VTVSVTEKLEGIKELTPKGVEFWRARELKPVLGYETWRSFENVIQKAITAFDMANESSANHFAGTSKMVEIGSGAEKEVDDYFLSRAACYIIAMNGETTKPEIAEAQKYFAVQTRRMEKLERLVADQRRVALRNRVKDRNGILSGTAKAAGVRRFGLFHGAGIRALYEMPLAAIKARKGTTESEDWLDRAGIEELAANEFRITQADSKIKRENIRGEDRAITAHVEVAKEIRSAIERLGNRMPEDLPAEPPIKEVERRLEVKPPKQPAPEGPTS